MTTARIHRVWGRHDAVVGGRRGLEIHCSVTIMNYQPSLSSPNVTIIYWFYYANGAPIQGALYDYTDARGFACVSQDFRPPYANSQNDDFTVFMPYEAFKLGLRQVPNGYCNVGVYVGNQLIDRQKAVLTFPLPVSGRQHSPEERPRPRPSPSPRRPEASPRPRQQQARDGGIWDQLGIPGSASKERKKRMLMEKYNTYRARVNHPDLEKRQEAERMLELISRANKAL